MRKNAHVNGNLQPPPIPWHSYTESRVFRQLNANPEGLREGEAVERQQKYGPNLLPTKPPTRFVTIFFSQFKNPLIYVLIVASVISLMLREYTDAGFIFAVLMLNAIIGSFQEWRAERSAASLQQLLRIVVNVKRGGKKEIREAADLVPGDLVYLESGNRVPADIRLLQSNQLSVDESLLTGESVSVHKISEAIDEEVPVSDRKNMAYAGSTVMSGRGMGLVVATGYQTEVGSIAQAVTVSVSLKPPLVIRMEQFARQVARLVLIATGLLALVAFVQGIPYDEIFFFAVALAVSAIPEGLPVAITVALAIATKRMSRRNVIVRKLTAVEGLGSCTFIASDKTGTLTVNKQTVKKIILPEGLQYDVTGEGYHGDGTIISPHDEKEPDSEAQLLLNALGTSGTICNESSLTFEDGQWLHQGDAVDLSLLSLTYKNAQDPQGIRDEITITGELPFESERKYAATFYQNGQDNCVSVKGALETILPFCDTMLTRQGVVAIEAPMIEQQARALTGEGYRVLALASASLNAPLPKDVSERAIPPLTFHGLVGLIDPLRPEAKDAVRRCREAGVEVAIVTGDHPLTAFTIARELGIAEHQNQVITGQQLEDISSTIDDEFIAAVRGKRVFARVTPVQKMQIVEAMSKGGHYIAVTGDGINDVPALKKANIGIAMGSGTDLAKETADIIVTDDNFSSIVAGIEGGRFAYDNIRKVTYLLISSGAAEIVLFIFSLAAGLPLPLAAVQLLWLNLVTNGIQDVALAFEGGEPETMKRAPRKPSEGIINRLMIRQTLLSGSTIGLIAFGTWGWLLYQGYDEYHARTLLLMLMVFMEGVHVFNCRSEYTSAFRVPLSRNWLVVGGVVLAQLVHILASYTPFMQKVLETDAVALMDWLSLFALSLLVLLVMELFKLTLKRKTMPTTGS